MEDSFDRRVAPWFLGGGVGLVLVHVLGIQTVHSVLLVATVPAMAIGAYGVGRYCLRKCGLLS